MNPRGKLWISVVAIVALAVLAGLVSWPKTPAIDLSGYGIGFIRALDVKLGLDLSGGTQLVYQADLGSITDDEKGASMSGVRDVIERRVNSFGVGEPRVQIQGTDRLIIELPGVTDVTEAVRQIGQTPTLEFREESDQPVAGLTDENGNPITSVITDENGNPIDLSALTGPQFVPTELTGKQLKHAQVVFQQQGVQEPEVSLEFNDEGKKLFAQITERSVGKRLAIYIDGVLISAPVVNQKIADGSAVITGSFSLEEARALARNLNAGALPVPINLVSQQNVGATLGQEAVARSVFAGAIGILAVALFMIIFYRIPGLVAVVALGIYALILLALFKLVPVTLTLSGVAGFILSIGIAVDANVLTFERVKERLQKGDALRFAVQKGFHDSWPSIRDSHVSSLITAVILYWLGTSIVQGFALTFALGIVISLFSAIMVTRTFLSLVVGTPLGKNLWWLGVHGSKDIKKLSSATKQSS